MAVSHYVSRTPEYRFFVSTPADQHDLDKAMHWARQEFEKVHGRRPEFADDIWTKGDEEHITVYFHAPEERSH